MSRTRSWLKAGLLIVVGLSVTACTPLAVWWEARNSEVVPQVENLPFDYTPLQFQPPYSGPHPSQTEFDVAQFTSPIRPGETGAIDRTLGPLQYPFACETQASQLGQPLVDNQDGIGTPVIIDGVHQGYSKDCLLATRVDYFYKPLDTDRIQPLTPEIDPTDIDTAQVNGKEVPFVLRLERGTINRFIYAIAVLADPATPLQHPDTSLWNGRLIYAFRGGVGIGKRQGDMRPTTATRDHIAQLAQGYAIAYSTGTVTSVHYNIWIAAHTAAMVKHQFVGLYGEPEYTVGIGGSGGAVQQLLIAQNNPGLLDAVIPQYSYPDMVTQTIWAYDCELLEYYFDVTARNQKRWRIQEQRSLIMGLAADSEADNPFNDIEFWSRVARFEFTQPPKGATECAVSWRGLTPLTNNPTYTNHADRYAPGLHGKTRWSHWHDLKYIYGVDKDGFANRTYDNVGVQYGLLALRKGDITPAEFLHLNANIGGWKPPREMRPERYWLLNGHSSLRKMRLWSDHNMRKAPEPIDIDVFQTLNHATAISAAPRNRGHVHAIQAAYHAGQVFLGNIEIPIVDLRHYLDDQLDMHHSFASQALRLRLMRGNGHIDNHLTWVAAPPFDPTAHALDVIDEWLTRGKPQAAQDGCWDSSGNSIAVGPDVWDGEWNESTPGACMQKFPTFKSPRDAAGAPLTGDIFKCHLQPVAAALENGAYGDIDMRPHIHWLEQIFSDGVCNYAPGDVGRPAQY